MGAHTRCVPAYPGELPFLLCSRMVALGEEPELRRGMHLTVTGPMAMTNAGVLCGVLPAQHFVRITRVREIGLSLCHVPTCRAHVVSSEVHLMQPCTLRQGVSRAVIHVHDLRDVNRWLERLYEPLALSTAVLKIA